MIEHMQLMLKNFPGEDNRVRCFNHIVNLVAKSLLKLFDVPSTKSKGPAGNNDSNIDAAERALQELAADLEVEDLRTQLGNFQAEGDEGCDNEDVNVDEIAKMTPVEAAEFRRSVLPVRKALVKVQRLLYTYFIVNY
jgi:hypothetical protein